MTTESQGSRKTPKTEAPLDVIGASQPLWGAFRDILRESIGLKSDLIQDNILRVALRDLSTTLGDNPNLWLESVKTDPAIRHQFCEHFTVGETWFFRDWTPFACLKQFAEDFRNRNGSSRPIRILSIPCSTGQEPWSMAMQFAWTGWTADQVAIDALDLNQASLAAMKTRLYKNFSRRESNQEANLMLDHYTRPLADGFEVDPQLVKYVKIHHGNILDPQLDPTGCGAKYDVIFSRNLFIYLDIPSRAKAMANLLRLLDKDGILYFGHAEGSVIEGHGLVSWNSSFTFAFTRSKSVPVSNEVKPVRLDRNTVVTPANAPTIPAPPKKQNVDPKPKNFTSSGKYAESKKETPPQKAIAPPPSGVDDQIAKAQMEADAGNLANAAILYQGLLKNQPMNGKLWRMAATVEQARGQAEEAIRMYDRALYLDPKDAETLRMLSLIRRQRGEIARAEQLERRLASLAPTGQKQNLSDQENPVNNGGRRK